MFRLFLLFLLTHRVVKAVLNSDPDLPEHCLRAHNDYRNRHKSLKLVWSLELAEQAQKWANHLAAIDQMERDPSAKDGENIFYMYGGDPSEACDRAVENWYSEIRNYDFKDPKENPSTDHFSQIIWKNTKELGVGTAQSKSGNFFLVARYKPSGNTDGSFKDNVEAASDGEAISTRPKDAPSAKAEPADSPSSGKTTKGGHFALPYRIFDSEISNVSQPSGNISTYGGPDLAANPPLNPGTDMLMAPPKYGKDYQVEIRFTNIVFTEKMNNPHSKEYHDVKLAITSAILQLYEDFEPFQEVQLLNLRNGSVIATIGLIFTTIGHNYLDRLTQRVAAGKLGDLIVARDYIAADIVPPGYLRLTLPIQHGAGTCPQPCSTPGKCFPDGCQVGCCSFDPIISPTEGFPVHETHHIAPTSSCPATCPVSCYPQCTEACCADKPKTEAQTAKPFVTDIPVPQTTPSPAIVFPGYTCPQSCTPACLPDCNQQCCNSPTVTSCSNQCAQYCGTECPQECCEKKSGVHASHFGKAFLPPLHHGMAGKSAYMYRPKYGSQRNPVKPHVHKPAVRPMSYRNRFASYWQPFLKLAQNYGYGAKRASSRNKVVPNTRTSYKPNIKAPPPQKNVYYRPPAQNRLSPNPRVQKPPYQGKIQNSGYYGNGQGMKFIKDLKSKGAPVNVRYAYRYGNRLLVPIDLPKGMDLKEMKGRKFISVPAFKKTEIPNAND